jgi:hypothetical protein
MSEKNDIPVLTDLIEPGPEITLSDLGLDDDPAIGVNAKARTGDIAFDLDDVAPIAGAAFATPPVELDPVAVEGGPTERGPTECGPSEISPALEQTVRRILDEHMELAWQEIRLAIQQHIDRS